MTITTTRYAIKVDGVEFRRTLSMEVRAGFFAGRTVYLHHHQRGHFRWIVRAGRFSISEVLGRGTTAAEAVQLAKAGLERRQAKAAQAVGSQA